MYEPIEPIDVVLLHDVLCPWSWIADKRLALVREELGDLVRISYKPFPLRTEETIPSRKEKQAEARNWRKAAKEKELKGICDDLWRSDDPPRSSLPPLIALEAARIIGGVGGRDRMLAGMRTAAFHLGLNVSRDDVLIEIADRCRLDVARFSTALRSSGTKRLVTEPYEEACFHGIQGVPAVVIGDEWILSGARTVEEYRETIERWVEKRGVLVPERVVH